jgi:hypothetical protein
MSRPADVCALSSRVSDSSLTASAGDREVVSRLDVAAPAVDMRTRNGIIRPLSKRVAVRHRSLVK